MHLVAAMRRFQIRPLQPAQRGIRPATEPSDNTLAVQIATIHVSRFHSGARPFPEVRYRQRLLGADGAWFGQHRLWIGHLVQGFVEQRSVLEPASWALMLGDFGLVGGVMRSGRKAAVSSHKLIPQG
jgi:hypothetical protein